MRPKNKNYATSLRKYATSVKKYATNIKKMPPFYGRNRIFQRKFFNFSKKKMLPAAENMLPKQKLSFLCYFFFGKTVQCKLCFFYAGTIAQGFLCYLQKKYATSKRQIMLLTTKKCKKMLPAAENKLLNQKLSFLC